LFGLSWEHELGTVLIIGPIKIRIHTAECGHSFAHVHMWTPDGEAVIFLEGNHEPAVRGRPRAIHLAKAVDAVEAHHELLMTMWNRLRPR
jgi:hypothetical protein